MNLVMGFILHLALQVKTFGLMSQITIHAELF